MKVTVFGAIPVDKKGEVVIQAGTTGWGLLTGKLGVISDEARKVVLCVNGKEQSLSISLNDGDQIEVGLQSK